MTSLAWILVIYYLWSNIPAFQAADGLLEDNFLLALDGKVKKIYQIALDGSEVNTLPLTGLVHPVAVDYDPVNKMVFWTDVGKNSKVPSINSAKLTGEDQQQLITLTRGSSPEGIAIDPYVGLVFYADNGPDHIRVLKYSGLEERSIILNAHNPRCVRLDPVHRHVYWSDWGTGTIERSSYDGSGRIELIKQDGAWINNVALDLQGGWIYWTDAKNDVIKMADMMDGTSMTTVVDASDQTLVHYYGITLDRSHVYVTDWTKENLYYSPKDNSTLTVFSLNHTFSVVNSIHAYVSDLYPKPDEPSPCTTNVSGCQQLCLPLGEADNYTCQCNDQSKLTEDGKTCQLIDTGSSNGPDVIWLEFDGSNTGYIRGINGKPQTFLLYPSLQTWLIRSPLWHWTALDFDTANKRLFLVDKFDKYITQLSLEENLQLKTIHSGVSGETDGLAYDWLSDSLYWTDALYNWIQVSHAQPYVNHVKTILTDLDHPHGIAIDPKAGLMFWADRGVQDQIMSARLSGEDKRVIVSSTTYLNRPTGITLDIGRNTIYWCNSNQLMAANKDGSNIRTLFSTTANFVGLTLQNNYLMAIDKGAGTNGPYLWFFNKNSPTRVPKMPLYRQPQAITMYNSDLQPRDGPTMTCELCDHICISSSLHDNHTQCLCSDGFQLGSDGKSCVAMATAAAPGFVFSLGDRICAVSIEDTHKKNLDLDGLCFFQGAAYFFPALDFDFKMGEIYFSETNQSTKTIRRANLNYRDNNSVVVYGVGDVYGLAVDYISDNLYWADYSRGQIWVSRVDGTHQKLLLDNRIQARALVLNVRVRTLYWSEFTTEGKCVIMSAATDGSMMRVFVTGELENVTGLFVDYSRERLYWADQGEGEVESVAFTGNDRQKEENLNKLHLNTYDLALFEDIMGIGETPVTTAGPNGAAGLYLIIHSTGETLADELTYPGVPAAYDVLGYNQGNQPNIDGNAASSCAVENGFCEQLCLHITVDTYRCACVDGMELDSDNTSCYTSSVKKDKVLLVADDYQHTVHGIDPKDRTSFYSYKLPPMGRPISVTYDPVRGYIYWSEFTDGTIKRVFLDGSNMAVLRSGETGSKVNGLAFDPDTEILYYTDSTKAEIGLLSPTGAYRRVLISDSEVLTNVHCITLDVARGHMYFSVMQRRYIGKIMRADLDGQNMEAVINTSLQYPTGIALDRAGGLIYWMDKYTGKIEVASLTGDNRREVYQLDPKSDPFGIALVDSTLYWTDWNNPGLFHIDTDGTNYGVVLGNELRGLNGIEYVNMDLMAPNVCTMNTGPTCTHFCIPTPDVPKCLCPDVDPNMADSANNCSDQVCPGGLLFATLNAGCGGHTGEMCEFTCTEGYFNVTDTSLTCRAGFEWDKDIRALCEVGTCVDSIPNGQFTSLCGMTVGEQCDYVCEETYVKLILEPLECATNLQWDHDLSTVCQQRVCPALDLPTHTKTSTRACRDAAAPGTQCKLACAPGYVQESGGTLLTCNSDLTWNGTVLQCRQAVTCVGPGGSPNTRVLPDLCTVDGHSFTVGASCMYSCLQGYTQAGGLASRVCLETGAWSGSPLNCVAVATTTNSSATTTTIAAGKPSAGPIVEDTSQEAATTKSNKGPIVIGTVFGVVVLATFLIVVAVVMYKRSKRSLGHYRDSGNYSPGKADDLEPVVSKEELSASYNSQGETVDLYGSASLNNNLYTNQPSRHIKMDGSVAFSNPDYEDVDIKVAEPMAPSEEINCELMQDPLSLPEVQVEVTPGPGAEDRTAFSNPLYANQQFTLGEDIQESNS